MPVVFHLRGVHFAWAWCTRVHPTMVLHMTTPSGGHTVRLEGLHAAVRYAFGLLDGTPPVDPKVDESVDSAFVRLLQDDIPHSVPIGPCCCQTTDEVPCPTDVGDSPWCFFYAPSTTMVSRRPLPPPQSAKTQPKKRARHDETVPPSEDEEADDRSDSVTPYRAEELGGHQEEVLRLATLRPKWDEEIVLELLRWGAHPPLHRIHFVHEGRFRKVQCTFVEPSGALVHDVWVTMGFLKVEYPRHVSHL